ncbi:MAG: FAD-dependent oxidoreductase, partial [Candidatus Thioglobus sp.]
MSDCLIVGGGVIGLMNARVLALSGAKVTLFDQSECGKESSWAGGGIISPLYPWMYSDFLNEMSFKSQAIYQNLCAQLLESTGIDSEYLRSGLLMMDEYDSLAAVAWLKKNKISYKKHTQGALFTEVAQVRNPRLLKALKADIIALGVEIIEHSKVDNLIIDNEAVRGIVAKNKRYFADNTIICAGAWSSFLLGSEYNIFPIKGQMIVLKPRVNVIENIVLDKGRYLIPRKDGSILVGSTTEDVGFDKSTDEQTAIELLEFASSRFAILDGANIEHHW